jgi:hypothetical protein
VCIFIAGVMNETNIKLKEKKHESQIFNTGLEYGNQTEPIKKTLELI